MPKIKTTKADDLFSLWVRLRDNWTCQRCQKRYIAYINKKGWPTAGSALHASHFKGRAKQGTRFEPLNVDAMCHGCHRYLTAQPDEHLQWQVKTKGQKIVDKIILQAHTYQKKNYKLEEIYWRRRLKKDFGVEV